MSSQNEDEVNIQHNNNNNNDNDNDNDNDNSNIQHNNNDNNNNNNDIDKNDTDSNNDKDTDNNSNNKAKDNNIDNDNNNNNNNNDTTSKQEDNNEHKDDKATTPISLLSYNLFVRPPGVKTNQSDYKTERLNMFLEKEIEKFDIVCLQEMFGFASGKKKKFIERAAAAGLVYWADIPVSWKNRLRLKLIDSGLLILSKHRLEETDYIIFSKGRNADGWCNKGALYAKVETGETPLQVITTHLQAGYTYNDNNDIQTLQLAEFHKFVKSKLEKNPEAPMLLVGDFNVNGRQSAEDGNDSDEYLRMMEKLKFEGCDTRDLLKECHEGEHPITTNDAIVDEDGKWKPRETVLTSESVYMKCKCLDYILYITPRKTPSKPHCQPISNQSQVEPFFVSPEENVPFTQLSDHYGVSSRFKIQ